MFLVLTPCTQYSIAAAWKAVIPKPVGILDQVVSILEIKIFAILNFLKNVTEGEFCPTASIYLPQQSRLVIGRNDGSIVIIPATQTVMMQVLHNNHQLANGKLTKNVHNLT